MQRRPFATASSIAYSATSVLPAPVGALTRTLCPPRIASTAWTWNGLRWKPFQWRRAPGVGPAATDGTWGSFGSPGEDESRLMPVVGGDPGNAERNRERALETRSS